MLSENGASDDETTLDGILIHIGQFGNYQIMNYMLLCLPMVFNAFFSISYVFTAGSVMQRCNVTQCDSVNSSFLEPWMNFTIPMNDGTPDQCRRFASLAPLGTCIEENFDRQQKEECGQDMKYRDSDNTISREFRISCSDVWKLSLVGTINNVGQFVGIPLGGFIADNFGRRSILAVGGFLSAIMGIVRSFSVNYYMFIVFEFLDMVVGSTLFPTAFLLAIELVGPRRRVAAATIITTFYSLGEAMLGLLAGQFQDWRLLLRILYIPAILHITFLWLLPESVRWLLSQGKEDKAVELLNKAAAVNHRRVPEATLQHMIDYNREKCKTIRETHFPITAALRLFTKRIALCCFCWFTNTLIALGLSLTSVSLAGNKYTNFMLNGLIQIPGLLLPLMIMDRIGRRFSLCGSLFICAVCIGVTPWIGNDHHNWELALFLLGKLAITSSFHILYFFTAEIFPTNVRNSLLSFCSMVGRIGSMLAPFTSSLISYYQYAPQIIFTVFALASAFATLFLPETTDAVLPNTISDAIEFKAKKFKARDDEKTNELPKNS